jgi:nucleoid-associated protein YgaU
MSTRRTYKPDARDGDGDGLVQDGTIFERPVGVEFTEAEIAALLGETIETEEHQSGPVSESETITPSEHPNTHTVVNGDSYAALADQYPTDGMTKHQRATELFHINNARKLIPGTVINLKESE